MSNFITNHMECFIKTPYLIHEHPGVVKNYINDVNNFDGIDSFRMTTLSSGPPWLTPPWHRRHEQYKTLSGLFYYFYYYSFVSILISLSKKIENKIWWYVFKSSILSQPMRWRLQEISIERDVNSSRDTFLTWLTGPLLVSVLQRWSLTSSHKTSSQTLSLAN